MTIGLKKWTAVLLAMALLMTSLLTVMGVTAGAASDVEITLSDVSGRKGETVEIEAAISANSYLVNGDMVLNFDPKKL